MDILLGCIASIILAYVTFELGRRKNDSEINKNLVDAEKGRVEILKLETDNKLAQVDLFDKLNNALTEQNEKLLASNQILIEQSEKLIKYIRDVDKRVLVLEGLLDNLQCITAPKCVNRIKIKNNENKI